MNNVFPWILTLLGIGLFITTSPPVNKAVESPQSVPLEYEFVVPANSGALYLEEWVGFDLDDSWRGVVMDVDTMFVPLRPVTGYAAAVIESFVRLSTAVPVGNQVGSLSSTVGTAARGDADPLPVQSSSSTVLLWEGLPTSWNNYLVLDLKGASTYSFDAEGPIDGEWRIFVTLTPVLD